MGDLLTTDSGLIFSYIFDGKGGGKEVGWDAINNWQPNQGILWVHLDHTEPSSIEWLSKSSGLSSIIVQVLISDEPRPRSIVTADDITIVLRGVNLNPGQDPEDMVSVRVWLDKNRIISTRHRRILSIADLRDAIQIGTGPKTTIEFLITLIDRLSSRMHLVVNSLSEEVDRLEEGLMTSEPVGHRYQIMQVRQMVVLIRRYLHPQEEAIYQLEIGHSSLLSNTNQIQLRESADRVTRYVEQLDATRERASILHEEVISRSVDLTNQRMYLLAVVSLIFLPLSFLNGLLGINVSGIPGASNDLAFFVVVTALVFIGIGIFGFLKIKKWI